jgi:hypothetical protein
LPRFNNYVKAIIAIPLIRPKRCLIPANDSHGLACIARRFKGEVETRQGLIRGLRRGAKILGLLDGPLEVTTARSGEGETEAFVNVIFVTARDGNREGTGNAISIYPSNGRL